MMTLYKVCDINSGTIRHYYGNPERARRYVAKVVNVRERVYDELDYVVKSFEAAKRNLDQIQQQIRQVCVNLEATPARTGRRIIIDEAARMSSTTIDWDEEGELERLKKEVSSIKSKIPYNLIYPRPSLSDQLTAVNPIVVWHPRSNRTRNDSTYALVLSGENMDLKLSLNCNPVFYFLHPPDAPPTTPPSLDEASQHQSINSLNKCWSTPLLYCLRQFPIGVIIKRTLLLNCFLAQSSKSAESSSSWADYFDDAINNLVMKGLLKTICKRSTSTVSSYWIEGVLESHNGSQSPNSIHFSPSPSEDQEILYSHNRPVLQKMKFVKSLLLGKWHRSLPLSQHIEVADPDLFYKGMEKLTEVRYISLRGISMIPELPQFITKLKKLQILDCSSCHNLEVIPDNINKLSRTLTRLDMSECHLLDHMPTTLSDLIHLQVLKGFHVGEPGQHRKSCTLRDLAKLSKLRKLHICTSLRGFPNTDHLMDFQKFRSLRKLGISWRACHTHDESTTLASTVQRVFPHKDSTGDGGGDQQFSFDLEKLDLQCVPNTVTRGWLNPVVFKGLKRLYITGGKFSDLGQILDERKEEHASIIVKENQWTVGVLRLKHLRELKMDRGELDNLFPKLINLEKVDCPNITSCCDGNGIWLKSTHPDLKQICLNCQDLMEEENSQDLFSFFYDHNGGVHGETLLTVVERQQSC